MLLTANEFEKYVLSHFVTYGTVHYDKYRLTGYPQGPIIYYQLNLQTYFTFLITSSIYKHLNVMYLLTHHDCSFN